MAGRNVLFAQLKPPAVALSEALVTLSTPQRDVRAIEGRLSVLEQTVKASADDPHFDSRLADYAFFPIAQILKHSQLISLRCLEICLSIVSVLISRGWSYGIQPALAQQLLTLCTLLAGKNPPSLGTKESSAELRAHALNCLQALFSVSSRSKNDQILPLDDAHIPQLGQAVSTILDGLSDSTDHNLETSAQAALHAFLHAHWPLQMLWKFLPGIVSMLTKVLKPNTSRRRSASVLAGCLNTLQDVLRLFFSDGREQHAQLDVDAALPQIKTALGSLSKLIDHDKHTVRTALSQLFLMVLEDCSRTLQNCIDLALEVVITLALQPAIFRLSMLITHNQLVRAALQQAVYDWSTSLVRIMQSADERRKVRRIEQIRSAYSALAEANVDHSVLDQELERCLTDGLVALLQDSEQTAEAVNLVKQHRPLDIVVSETVREVDARSSLITQQVQTTNSIVHLLESICNAGEGESFVAVQNRLLLTASGTSKIARLWLMLNTLETMLGSNDDLGQYIQVNDPPESIALSPAASAALETAYILALDVLTKTDEEESKDPRLKSLSLQTIALKARLTGRDFRYELVDVLYPVLDTLAASQGALRQESIATMKTFNAACDYASIPELIIDNVDYLTNAVALKLNSFDVSPQAPQILLMMVRLAGPGLLPYLEDTVESIFVALEDYHGYPLLVELLFKTLAAMAQEGCKAPAFSSVIKPITSGPGQAIEQATTITSLAELIRDHTDETMEQIKILDDVVSHAPHEPWSEDADAETHPAPSEIDKSTPPAPKIYGLLLKITDLTQHFLSSESPSLRLSLLTLIQTTIPAIAKHEDSFLPLINTLWPEIVARLDGDDPAIKAAAMDVIAAICENAGDFMRSRISDFWSQLTVIWYELHREAQSIADDESLHSRKSMAKNTTALMLRHDQLSISKSLLEPFHQGDTALRQHWQAFLHLLVIIVQHVPISADHFDDALNMAHSELNLQPVYEAFNSQNADAVWLCRLRSGYKAPSDQTTTGKVIALTR